MMICFLDFKIADTLSGNINCQTYFMENKWLTYFSENQMDDVLSGK